MESSEEKVTWQGVSSRDPAVREAAMRNIGEEVRVGVSEEGTPAAPTPLNPTLARLLMLSRRCPFPDVRHKCLDVLTMVQVLKLSFDADFEDPIIKPLLEFAWHEYLCEKKKELKGETWAFSSLVMCFVNGQLVGDDMGLKAWANEMWGYNDYRPLPLYKALAEDFYTKHIRATKHSFIYLDIAIEEKHIGRLLFELFSDICPKTCRNFQNLCTGESGDSPNGIKLHYKGSLFHRIVKNGWIQGGDIVSGKGNGGESIFGGTFEDENFAVSHSKRGILGMANKGRHTNASQFYITLQKTPYMDRKQVAFGQLVEGSDVLKQMEEIATYNERPKLNCTIVDCGIFKS